MFIIRFLGSTRGRAVRVVAGAGLLIAGAVLGGPWWILAGVGAVVAGASALDVCLLAPLVGKPIPGPRFRASFAR
ncbi:DUF2892 domain-containing protein [Amnibacterium kyonggiense]|uniref:DUF2892 family protein n=1 Tax=Amnibacterium kyonggiense TaxID=595671 RepID=A0A4R7FR48_9MICO|nr:DUF2892 domain-containing protein [Amnibacterium kyonggiense]TDS80295.1 Protein of unknown function (DUF2892) [Amnibacterium kyonggiense]